MNNIYRVALFLPSITSTVAVSIVWLWIFNPDMGLINNFLMAIGLNDVPMWLGDTAWSKPALVIMRVWQMGGYYMIMFLAGLQTIRGERKAITHNQGADDSGHMNAVSRDLKPISLKLLSFVTN